MKTGEVVKINGDGETSRDFCYVENAVQSNILAALASEEAKGHVYNVAVGERTTLNEVFAMLKGIVGCVALAPEYLEFRKGDVRHSQADISKAVRLLGYSPSVRCQEGLFRTVKYFDSGVQSKES
jgi:UDP-N-acetylglucosamine 4-epimerase